MTEPAPASSETVGSVQPAAAKTKPGQRWIAEHPLVAGTIAGAIVYGVLRRAQVTYYGEFGVVPEDVGIGYGETLVRVLPGLVVVAICLVVVAMVLSFFVQRRLARRRGKEADTPDPVSDQLYALMGLMAAFVLLLLFLLEVVPSRARSHAEAVKRGDERHISTDFFALDFFDNILAIDARRVSLDWVDREAPPTTLGSPVMLVGAGSDVYYLYDVENRRTVRVPRSLAVLYDED